MSRPPDWEPLAELAELGVWTASLLHELRQPLFAVRGRLQLAGAAGRSLDPAEMVELLELVDHAQELLDHYGGLGRPGDSWIELDLRESVREALGLLRRRPGIERAVVRTELPGDPVWILGRGVAMRQVVTNLLQNAIDAVADQPRGEVVVRIEVDERARVVVTDTGPGVPEALRTGLFEPFVSGKPAGHGTGLGLYIARRLVEEAGGTLRLETSDPRGTVMVAELPVGAGPGA